MDELIERLRRRAADPDRRTDSGEAMGLPEVGWEQVVWGGLGLAEDEER